MLTIVRNGETSPTRRSASTIARDRRGAEIARDPYPGRDHEIVRPEVDRPELADAVDALGAGDRVANACDDLHGRRLADEEALGFAVHQQTDRHQEHADRNRGERVPGSDACDRGQKQAQRRYRDPGDRSQVLEEDDDQVGCLRVAKEASPGRVPLGSAPGPARRPE